MSEFNRWAVCLLLLFGGLRSSHGQASSENTQRPNVPIDFEGFLPGLQDANYSGRVMVEFSIFLTPTGGRPIWTDKFSVVVANGRIDIRIGLSKPIPWEITLANFKFLSARIDSGSEVLPRMPIVNVAFCQDKASSGRIGNYSRAVEIETSPRPVATWAGALEIALKENRTLPRYRDWYMAVSNSTIKECFGHYEWTMPWVYDTASHGGLNECFRGRLQGCDYMDLDPVLNKYHFRLVTLHAK